MPAGQQIPQDAASSANGHSSLHDLFALTDEQILEIEPETKDVEVSNGQPSTTTKEPPRVAPVSPESRRASLPADSVANTQSEPSRLEAGATQADHGAADATQPLRPSGQAEPAVPQEPPAWLATQMKDPWTAEEAKELWNGVQQARQEAAAYRSAIATPEDARALKELYPGGVNEARATAERARVLDDIDRAYFGASGKSAQEISASREQLAQRMLREDPAAFREMVFAGLRALEQVGDTRSSRGHAGQRPGMPAEATAGPLAADAASGHATSVVAQQGAPLHGSASTHDAQLAAYSAFEKAANEDLERSVGVAIARTLEQALPVAQPLLPVLRSEGAVRGNAETQARVPVLQERLSAAIRHDVEAALKGDRQLGEQIAQILSARRFDSDTRAQVVRLIDDRARQLVPSAAKRVLNDWTQATMAAHRGKTAKTDAESSRREVAPTASAASPAGSARQNGSPTSDRDGTRPDARRVDYRKLSDEQILEM